MSEYVKLETRVCLSCGKPFKALANTSELACSIGCRREVDRIAKRSGKNKRVDK